MTGISTPRRARGALLAAGVSLAALWAGAEAAAQEPADPDTILIEGQRGGGFDRGDTANTSWVIGADAARAQAIGGMNPYSLLESLPSVNASLVDPYGAANVPGGTKGLRIRGETSTHGAIGTIEGLPLAVVNPGPSASQLVDVENWDRVVVQQGPIPATSLAPFSSMGTVDTLLRWPSDAPGAELSQSFGSFELTRTFLRLDSGDIAGSGVEGFVSASFSDADKWRGPGKGIDGRENVSGGLSAELGERLSAKLFAVWNDTGSHNYRPLTYAQVTDLSANRELDYEAFAIATPAQAINFYDYNRQEFETTMVLGEVAYDFGGGTRLAVRPHYMSEKGEFLDGVMMMGMPRIRNWLVDHDWYGVNTDFQTELSGVRLTLGHWHASMEPPGPPTAWKMYSPAATGDRTFAMWMILADVAESKELDVLYAQAEKDLGALDVTGGVRYMKEQLPGLDFYNPMGVGDLSYEQALAASPGRIAGRSVDARTIDGLLPYASLRYAVSPALELKLAAGRSYNSPAVDLWPTYQMNAAALLAAGITADSLWKKLEPETADAVDASARISFAGGFVEPTLFYARYDNKGVPYDSGLAPGVAFAQNVGESEAKGAQLYAQARPAQGVEMFGSLGYTENEFTDPLPTYPGASPAAVAAAASVVGRQVPDTPVWTASVGASWQVDDISISPALRYLGERWGDTAHTQKLSDYVVTDLYIDWSHDFRFGALGASIAATNVLDEEYIGFVNTGYLQATSGTNAFFYPGAPRTVVLRLTARR